MLRNVRNSNPDPPKQFQRVGDPLRMAISSVSAKPCLRSVEVIAGDDLGRGKDGRAKSLERNGLEAQERLGEKAFKKNELHKINFVLRSDNSTVNAVSSVADRAGDCYMMFQSNSWRLGVPSQSEIQFLAMECGLAIFAT
jgi:hypothetical protein